jgi:hypothetical protein
VAAAVVFQLQELVQVQVRVLSQALARALEWVRQQRVALERLEEQLVWPVRALQKRPF